MVLSIILAVTLGYFAYLEHTKDNSILHQSIQATIMKVLIKERDVTGNSASIGGITIVNKRKTYEVWPQYQYKVNNVLYTGEYKTNVYNSISAAQNEYNYVMNNNKQIKIFYVRANPKSSALSYPKNNMKPYLIGACVAGVVAIITRYSTRANFKGKANPYLTGNANTNSGFTFTQYEN